MMDARPVTTEAAAYGAETIEPGATGAELAGAELAGTASTGAVTGERTSEELADEGDIAADYIEEFLDICDIDGDIDIDSRNGRAYVSVNSSAESNLRLLSSPGTVTALQELTRLAVQNKTGSFSRLILDIGGSREARQAELTLLVDRAIARLDEGAAQASLPAMSSYERKLVHDVVAQRGYVSVSEGEGRDRHTVITASA
ncbi:MAG: R3H domain-containing nucleic acid-binding protein [Microbacteriaceae bacterium]